MEIIYVVLDDTMQFDNFSQYVRLLPPERREKISRYRFDKDKLRSLAAGLLIRRVTGGGELVYGEHEKPYLADEALFFSVSHSGDIVAIASDTAEVGCDVEVIPAEKRLKIADRFYHPNEREYVYSSDDKTRAFCRIWTRKEAYLKMTGEGISSDLTAFDTTSKPLTSQIYTKDMDGYSLSVCSAEPIAEENIHISKSELKNLVVLAPFCKGSCHRTRVSGD